MNTGTKQTPVEDSFWGKFLQKTIDLDSTHGPYRGWHWFWGLYYLYNIKSVRPFFMLELVQEELHEQHWLKKINEEELKAIIASKEFIELLKFIDKLAETNTIENLIDFSKLHFTESANFGSFIFPLYVSFEDSKFSHEANFDAAIFCNSGNFVKAEFFGDTAFNDAQFVGVANFDGVKFLNNTSFNNVSFPIIANFQNTHFFKMSDFTNAIFTRAAAFRDATFYSLPVFKNATFKGNTNFIGVRFNTHAPHFYDATINADITWDKNTNLWPQTTNYENSEDEEKHKTRIENNQNSYENLVYHMKTVEKYHDEHFFFRKEMQCRRWFEKKPFNRLIFWLYENLADYGYGIDRAFKACAWHIVYGFIAILTMATISIIIQSWYGHWQGWINVADTFFCSALVSATNATPYVFIGADNGFLMNCYKGLQSLNPFIFNVIRIVQTVVGVALLFLLLLTLRVRFRIK